MSLSVSDICAGRVDHAVHGGHRLPADEVDIQHERGGDRGGGRCGGDGRRRLGGGDGSVGAGRGRGDGGGDGRRRRGGGRASLAAAGCRAGRRARRARAMAGMPRRMAVDLDFEWRRWRRVLSSMSCPPPEGRVSSAAPLRWPGRPMRSGPHKVPRSPGTTLFCPPQAVSWMGRGSFLTGVGRVGSTARSPYMWYARSASTTRCCGQSC